MEEEEKEERKQERGKGTKIVKMFITLFFQQKLSLNVIGVYIQREYNIYFKTLILYIECSGW